VDNPVVIITENYQNLLEKNRSLPKSTENV